MASFDRARLLSEHNFIASERYGSTAFITTNPPQAAGNADTGSHGIFDIQHFERRIAESDQAAGLADYNGFGY